MSNSRYKGLTADDASESASNATASLEVSRKPASRVSSLAARFEQSVADPPSFSQPVKGLSFKKSPSSSPNFSLKAGVFETLKPTANASDALSNTSSGTDSAHTNDTTSLDLHVPGADEAFEEPETKDTDSANEFTPVTDTTTMSDTFDQDITDYTAPLEPELKFDPIAEAGSADTGFDFESSEPAGHSSTSPSFDDIDVNEQAQDLQNLSLDTISAEQEDAQPDSLALHNDNDDDALESSAIDNSYSEIHSTPSLHKPIPIDGTKNSHQATRALDDLLDNFMNSTEFDLPGQPESTGFDKGNSSDNDQNDDFTLEQHEPVTISKYAAGPDKAVGESFDFISPTTTQQPSPDSPSFDDIDIKTPKDDPAPTFHGIEISQSPPAHSSVELSQSAPIVSQSSHPSLKKHVSIPSLRRNITGNDATPPVPDISFDDFDEYNNDETVTRNLNKPKRVEENIGHLSDSFKFPGSPRTVSSSSFNNNITRAARSGSITGGSNYNNNNINAAFSDVDYGFQSAELHDTSIQDSYPPNNQPYFTTFEAPTNLPDISGTISESSAEDSGYGFKSIDTSIPLSSRKSVNGLRGGESSHSVTLSPIEVDDGTVEEEDENIIYAVCVVGFHHIRGPEVEYWVGGDGKDQSKLWPNLPFQSLPDGSHSHEENFCYFSLLYDTKNKTAPIAVPIRDKVGNVIENAPDMANVTTLFGLSCNRQLKATDLKERPADVTRSTVQKSVVVIARKPIFGAIREKLAVITRAYFQQGDFEDRSLINSLYDNLVQMFSNKIDENDMYVGMSLRELIYRLRSKVLVLLKALFLEKKIFFFGNNTETLCSSQFALVSLIPNLINHLDDCGSPLLNTYEHKLRKPNSLKSSDRSSLLQYMGLPLQLFAEGGMFTAYVPLQQMSELKAPETKYFLVGSTNSLLLAPQNRTADIIVYIDSDNVEVVNTSLNSALALSSQDKKWIDWVVKAVVDTWDPEDPARPKGLGFHGSEDFVRQQFEDYIKGLLAAVKYDRFLARANHLKQPLAIPRDIEGNPIKQFNNNWIKEWRTTNNFRIFSKFTDDELFDIVEPKHMVSSMTAPAPIKSAPQTASGQSSPGDSGQRPPENVATRVTKAWESLWWGQSQQAASSSTNKSATSSIAVPANGGINTNGSSAEHNGTSNMVSNGVSGSEYRKHQSKQSDDFQDTSLYDQGEPHLPTTGGVSSLITSFNGGIIPKRNRSTTTSTTASNQNTTPTAAPLSTTQSNNSAAADDASYKSSRSANSGNFFNGWSLWGNSNKDGGETSSSSSVKSP